MVKSEPFDVSPPVFFAQAHTLLLLVLAGLLAGCQPPDEPQSSISTQASPDRAEPEIERSGLLARPGDSVKLFAYSPHYLSHEEPEKNVRGILSRAAAQTESGQHEPAIRLHTEQGEFCVYSEGISSQLLDEIVDQPLSITGKWTERSFEGAPVKVWIARVTVPTPPGG